MTIEKKKHSCTIVLPDTDCPIVIETGWVAKQTNGAVWVKQGGTVVLVTAVAGRTPEKYQDFFPLTVNYLEKMYSVGRFPGGYIKRETRPSDRETLTSRLIDRPLRPLFDDGFRNETQVVATVLSADGINQPDVLALNGASFALLISDIPYNTASAAVRIGKIDGKLIVNPKFEDYDKLSMNIIVAGTADALSMVEAGMDCSTEEEVIEALELAHDQIKLIVGVQEDFRKTCGKPKMSYTDFSIPKDILDDACSKYSDDFRKAFKISGKLEKYAAIDSVKDAYAEYMKEKNADDYAANQGLYKDVAKEVEKIVFRDELVRTHSRIDGRALDEVRPIDIECGVLPFAHGSALFTRGETQALVVLTLGSKTDSQIIDDIGGRVEKKFMLNYNFPPYSVGETGRMGAPGRREIGHGALAERAVADMVPPHEDFPYTLRVVSEILESNGSSSMASVCGASLAMMDAGVQIKSPVSGIAMGLVMQEDGSYVILTDIMGLEDHLGDMDFKVTGTDNGITALQMDIKIKGLSRDIMSEALAQAKSGRSFIMGEMLKALPKAREELSPSAPRFQVIHINPEKTGALIGPQGKNIKAIIEATGASIDIADGGIVNIFGKDKSIIDETLRLIQLLVAEAIEGETYTATVKKVMEYGAFVEILPGLEGLLHVSQYSHERINNIADHVNVGDKVDVKYIGKDRSGRIELSRKALLD